MYSFLTDDKNDLYLDDFGNLTASDGLDAYRQHLINELRLQQYEYPYDLTRGINYLGFVFGNRPNLQMWESQVLDLVTVTPFITSVENWAYEVKDRVLGFVLTVNTDLGQIKIKG